MPRNTTVQLVSGWTQLTDADVTNITFQNQSDDIIEVQATTGAAPSVELGSIQYAPQFGETNAALTDLFPGVASATRVWARCPSKGEVMVSHA